MCGTIQLYIVHHRVVSSSSSSSSSSAYSSSEPSLIVETKTSKQLRSVTLLFFVNTLYTSKENGNDFIWYISERANESTSWTSRGISMFYLLFFFGGFFFVLFFLLWSSCWNLLTVESDLVWIHGEEKDIKEMYKFFLFVCLFVYRVLPLRKWANLLENDALYAN